MSGPLTYPEFKPRPWALAMPWTYKDVANFINAGLKGAPDSPRTLAFKDLDAAIQVLVERGVRSFRGDKVHALLVAAARERGWMAPTGKYKAVPAASTPDAKVCRRCREEHPLDAFRAIATLEQKRRNGWREDSQRYITSLLCAKCRASKTRQEAARRNKRTAPTLLMQYRQSMAKALESTSKVIKRHATLTLPDGGRVLQFSSDENMSYYLAREALLHKVRDRLNLYVEEGTLLANVPNPPKGLWHELLTQDERVHLRDLYNDGDWMQRGYKHRIPTLWDGLPTGDPTEDVQEHTSVPDGTVIERPQPPKQVDLSHIKDDTPLSDF